MEGRPVVLVVAGRKRPHELLLFAYGVFLGVVTLTRPGEGSLSHTLPRWVVVGWAAGMIVSGLVGLTAPWLRPIGRALLVEFGALLIGAGALLIYAFAVLTVIPGFQGILSGVLLCAWVAANGWRAIQITVDLRATSRAGE